MKNKRLVKSKRLRVIQITGLKGILSAIFVVVCTIAGFVWFPALVLCKIWNYVVSQTGVLAPISIFQGFLLWGILAVSYIIINEKKRYFIAFEPKTVSGKDITEIIKQIKTQTEDFSNIDITNVEEEKKEDKVQNE